MTLRLCLKELRENALWALIALVVALLVVLTHALPRLAWAAGLDVGTYNTLEQLGISGLPLLEPMGVFVLFCAVWGAALGLVGHVVERARNTYQVLVTLPTTRGRVFLAKTGVGLVLYFASVGIPFAVQVYLAATPGHYPGPFRWWMVGPGLAAICGGACAYGAAVLTALRLARWYATRGLPLVVAAAVCLWAPERGMLGAAVALTGAAVMLWGALTALEKRDF